MDPTGVPPLMNKRHINCDLFINSERSQTCDLSASMYSDTGAAVSLYVCIS